MPLPLRPLIAPLRAGKRLLRRLAPGLHDALFGLYRASGPLARRLEAAKLTQRLDHLDALVEAGEADGRLEPAVAERLRAGARSMRRQLAEEGPGHDAGARPGGRR